MITNLPKWAAPGLATVLGGVALIVLLSPTAVLAQGVTAGTPPASQVVRPAAPSSSITVLAPPRVSDYWITATRQPGGVIVFDGYVPDDATRKALGATEGADTNWLKLGSGEPDAYQSALDFGMAALAHLSEGRFALRSNIVTLSGIARSSTDYEALTKLVGANPPAGVVLARNEITAPVAATFLWSASKAADGTIALSGMVPNADIRAQLIAAAGQSPTQSTMYASGAPADFATSAVSGLALLKRLDTGELTFGPDGWVLKGQAKSDADKTAIETDVAASEPKNWSVNVEAAKPIIAAAPPPAVVIPEPATAPRAPVETPPVVEPAANAPAAPAAEKTKPTEVPAAPAAPIVNPAYAFTASRMPGAAIALSGQVPADPALRYLGTVANAPTTGLTVTSGAPENFIFSATTGLRALATMNEGKLAFANGRWSLSGKAVDASSRDRLLAEIAALPSGADWTVDIAAPLAIDLCRTSLAEFSARNAILFRSGAALIADESTPALDELAQDLAACPDAVVHIEGYTDADGDAQLNLALSVARAEAVVSALVTRNVTPARLYAIGYGEANPIADNETAAGKRLNRRIVVSVLDEHY